MFGIIRILNLVEAIQEPRNLVLQAKKLVYRVVMEPELQILLGVAQKFHDNFLGNQFLLIQFFIRIKRH